jgi:hypothetical protein
MSMTFPNLAEALRAGFQIFDKHPDGYLVQKEIVNKDGRRWVLAIALVPRMVLRRHGAPGAARSGNQTLDTSENPPRTREEVKAAEVEMKLLGLDHADIRVPSLVSVERFYDALLPALGLSRKTEAYVGGDGEWYDVDSEHPRNAIGYHTPVEPGSAGWFVGFVEDRSTIPTATRIAFALDVEANLTALEPLVREAGSRIVEWSIEAGYPALFFEDPAGTRLEICARRPRA